MNFIIANYDYKLDKDHNWTIPQLAKVMRGQEEKAEKEEAEKKADFDSPFKGLVIKHPENKSVSDVKLESNDDVISESEGVFQLVTSEPNQLSFTKSDKMNQMTETNKKKSPLKGNLSQEKSEQNNLWLQSSSQHKDCLFQELKILSLQSGKSLEFIIQKFFYYNSHAFALKMLNQDIFKTQSH